MSNETTNATSMDEPAQKGRKRGRLHHRLHANPALSLTTKVVVTTLGVLVIIAGIVMMVTPGPGILALVIGLGILATEYDWAERWLSKAKHKAHEAKVRAEQMDPRVRRRRLMVSGLVIVVVVGGLVAYVVAAGWPSYAVSGWDWVQGLFGWLPELPGM